MAYLAVYSTSCNVPSCVSLSTLITTLDPNFRVHTNNTLFKKRPKTAPLNERYLLSQAIFKAHPIFTKLRYSLTAVHWSNPQNKAKVRETHGLEY